MDGYRIFPFCANPLKAKMETKELNGCVRAVLFLKNKKKTQNDIGVNEFLIAINFN